MPANLSPEFYKARDKFYQASTPADRLRALKEMLRTIPKHKGTDKMQADIKKRISKLKDEVQAHKKSGKQNAFWIIEKQGAGRLVLVGPANVGKSAFVRATTNATPEVASYPYTTQQPIPAMMPYKNVWYQLIDMPPLVEGHAGWMSEVIRTADIILIMFDLGSDDILSEAEKTFELIQQANINLIHPLNTRNNDENLEVNEDDLFGDPNIRKAIIVANKLDTFGAKERLFLLQDVCEGYDPKLPIHTISVTGDANLEELKAVLFKYLDVVRIYTKAPGKKANFNEPVVIPRGTTLIEAAELIHKDFAEQLKYARVWGENTFDGQRISSDYILEDEDVVEFHI